MQELEIFRHSNLIDPNLAIWDWEIPVYLFLGGLTAGLMVLGTLLRFTDGGRAPSRAVRLLPFVGPLVLSVGMLALFLDLAHKLHVYRFYLALRPLSPMSWGAWILVAIYPVAVLLGLGSLEPSEVDSVASSGMLRALRLGGVTRRLHAWSKVRLATLASLHVVLGVALGAYTGLLLGTLAARAAWNSVLLGPLFLCSGLSTGAALMMLLGLGAAEKHWLRRADLWAMGTELVLLGLFLLDLGVGGGEQGRAAAALFLGGRYTGAFFTLVVAAGLAVPMAIELLESRRRLRPTVMAPLLVLVGGLALRFILVLAGQA